MTTYRAALIGCGRIGAFIDNEVADPHPYSHAAAYEACERTTLVALADQRADVMARAGERYAVPAAHQYTDYREMLAAERPDIVSVATQPEQRAEIVIHAAEHGARAIYAEKAMAASLAEADAMVRAVEDNGVAFNMGTNRRWHPGFRLLRSLIAEGHYGALRSLTVHCGFGVFNMGSHAIDLVLMLNGDEPVSWVQFHVSEDADRIEGATLRADPSGGGRLQFANGVPAFLLDSGRPFEARGRVRARHRHHGRQRVAGARRGRRRPARPAGAGTRQLPAVRARQPCRPPDPGPGAGAGHRRPHARRRARRAHQHRADLRLSGIPSGWRCPYGRCRWPAASCTCSAR